MSVWGYFLVMDFFPQSWFDEDSEEKTFLRTQHFTHCDPCAVLGLLCCPLVVLLVLSVAEVNLSGRSDFTRGGAIGLLSLSVRSSFSVSVLFFTEGITWTVVMESGFPWDRYCRGPSYPWSSRLPELVGRPLDRALPDFRSFNSIFLFCICLFCLCFSSISFLCWSSLCCLMLADGMFSIFKAAIVIFSIL